MKRATTAAAVCRHFRQKRMYLGGSEAEVERLDPLSFAHCWCLETQQAFGPDDLRVDPDECVAGRRCYEPQ